MKKKIGIIVAIVALIIIVVGGVKYMLSGTAGVIDMLPESIQNVLLSDTPRTPSLKTKLVFPDDFPEDARVAHRKNTAEIVARLEKNPDSQKDWLDLAIAYAGIEDRETAKKIWEYLVVKYPESSVPLHNLGTTYHFYLKDFEKSEDYYRRAIALSPDTIMHYVGLHELYRYSYKQDTDLAAETLKEGIENNPTSIDLYTTLGAYYKSVGNIEQAIVYFSGARTMAETNGNTELVAALTAEIDRLEANNSLQTN